MVFGKKTHKSCATAIYRRSLALMVPELIIEELSIASVGMGEIKTVDVWTVLVTFFTILNPDQSYPFQYHIPNKVTLNIESAFKQELQKQNMIARHDKNHEVNIDFFTGTFYVFYQQFTIVIKTDKIPGVN